MYLALDYILIVFHNIITLFNLFGWLHPKTRKLHLVVITLTLVSWLGLGAFYGWGYCFLTDWHYQVLFELGEWDLPRSYITYILWRMFGLQVSDELTITLTGWVFAFVILATILVNLKRFGPRRG